MTHDEDGYPIEGPRLQVDPVEWGRAMDRERLALIQRRAACGVAEVEDVRWLLARLGDPTGV